MYSARRRAAPKAGRAPLGGWWRYSATGCTMSSVRRFGLGLALDGGLADHHRLALQAVQRLGELEVFGAAELRRRLQRGRGGGRLGGFVFELLARFLARLFAG